MVVLFLQATFHLLKLFLFQIASVLCSKSFLFFISKKVVGVLQLVGQITLLSNRLIIKILWLIWVSFRVLYLWPLILDVLWCFDRLSLLLITTRVGISIGSRSLVVISMPLRVLGVGSQIDLTMCPPCLHEPAVGSHSGQRRGLAPYPNGCFQSSSLDMDRGLLISRSPAVIIWENSDPFWLIFTLVYHVAPQSGTCRCFRWIHTACSDPLGFIHKMQRASTGATVILSFLATGILTRENSFCFQ